MNEQVEAGSTGELVTRYDAVAKRILSNRKVASYLVSKTADEFEGIDPLEIERRYLLSDPKVDSAPFDAPSQVKQLQNNEADPTFGNVTYDVVFEVALPSGGEEEVTMIVNFEPDGHAFGDGNLPERGIYYAARIISAQRDRVFKDDHYRKMRKVYSIWICFDASKRWQGGCVKYELKQSVIAGDALLPKERYDKLCVVLAFVKAKPNEEGGLSRFLSLLFGKDVTTKDRIKLLGSEYGIPADVFKEAEMGSSLGQALLEKGRREGEAKGRREGEAKGRREGEAKGRRETWVESALALRDRLGLDLSEALAVLNVPEDRRAECLEAAEHMT